MKEEQNVEKKKKQYILVFNLMPHSLAPYFYYHQASIINNGISPY